MDLDQISARSYTKFIYKTRLSLVAFNCVLDFSVIIRTFVLIGGHQSFREACCLIVQIGQDKGKIVIDPQADLPC
jgi:hypothetical protein